MRDSTEQAVKPSTTEALRQAIAALGYRAPVTDILDYARQHFGVGAAVAAPEAPAAQPDAAPAPKPAGRRGKPK